MSRLCILRLCSLKNIKTPETLLSRLHFKNNNRINDVLCRSCQRGYAQCSLQFGSYPLYKLIDRIFSNYPSILLTAREKYKKYSNKSNRKHRHFGILLGSLGLIVAFCDAPYFAGTYVFSLCSNIYKIISIRINGHSYYFLQIKDFSALLSMAIFRNWKE